MRCSSAPGLTSPPRFISDFAVSPWIGLVVAAIVGGALGAGMGYTVFRRKLSGVYFALVTLAVAEMALHIVSNVAVLGGANGLAIPSRPDFANFQFNSKLGFCYAALGVLAAVSAVSLAIHRSRLGYVLLAIRENERSAAALGIDVVQGKVIAARDQWRAGGDGWADLRQLRAVHRS